MMTETIKFTGCKGTMLVIHHTEFSKQFTDTISRKGRPARKTTGSVWECGRGRWGVTFGDNQDNADYRGIFNASTAYGAWEAAIAGLKGKMD